MSSDHRRQGNGPSVLGDTPNTQRRLLKRKDAAAYISVSLRTFDGLKKQLPYYQVASSKLYSTEDLDAWLETKRVEPATPLMRPSLYVSSRSLRASMSPEALRILERLQRPLRKRT